MISDLGLLIAKAFLVYLLVLWTHSLRHRVGLAPFYIFLGGLAAIMSWVTDAGVQVEVSGITFVVGSTVFYTSLLLGVFVLYVFDGPRATRIAIVTVAGVSVLTPLVSMILHLEGAPLNGLPMPSLRVNTASVLTTIADMFFLAFAWEFFGGKHFKSHLWVRGFLTLLGVMLLDIILFSFGAFAGSSEFLSIMEGTLLSRFLVTVFASLFLYVYLTRESRRSGDEIEQRPLLSILSEMQIIRSELLSAREQLALRRRLEDSQTLAQATLDALPEQIVIVDQLARIVSANRRWIEFFRKAGLLKTDTVVGLDYRKMVKGLSGNKVDSSFVDLFIREGMAVLSGKKDFYEQSYLLDLDGVPHHFIGRIAAMMIGGVRHAVVIHMDETDRERARRRQQLLNQIFYQLNQRGDRDEILKQTISLIRQHSGFEAVGIRLCDDGDCPYVVAEGYPDEFLKKETFLCSHDSSGSLVQSDDGKPLLQCMCGSVICGRADAALPCFSGNGSFWTNRMSELNGSMSELGLSWPIRTACCDQGYESMVMVPLRAGDEIVGLLQMNDSRSGLLNEDRVRFFEELGVAIGVELQQAQVEQALRESEQNLRYVISSIHDGLWDWDVIEDRFICSPQWFRMLGYDPDAFSLDWKKFEEMIHPDDVQKVLEAVRTYFCGEARLYSVEFRMRRKDNTYGWIWARGSVVKHTAEGDPARMIGVHVNVTEAHQAKEALEESRRSYRQLFDSMQSGFALHEIICNEHGEPCDYRFLRVNKAFENLTGLHSKDLVGRTVKEVLPGTEDKWIQTYGRVAQTGEAITIEDFSGMLGRYYSVTAYSPSKGQFATVFNDVTERKNAERAILNARDAAEESNRAKSHFLANMSHELRTPLNAIIGLSELLADTSLNEEQSDYVQTISDSGASLLNIISDLLDFSKIDLQQVKVKMSGVSVQDVVRKSAVLLKSAAQEKGIKLSSAVDSDVPEVIQADPERLQQVFVNLLNNAVKFTHDGFVRFHAKTKNTSEGTWVEFSVADSGEGMDEQTLKRIFKPFQQGDSSSTRQHGGSGLGLAISKNLVEVMGGTLSVDSSPGKGSIFRVVFPVGKE